jgi:hypothetical protein
MAFGVGLINLSFVHLKTIALLKKDAIFSVILLSSLIGTILFGLVDWYQERAVARFFLKAQVYQSFFEKHSEEIKKDYYPFIKELAVEASNIGFSERYSNEIVNLEKSITGSEISQKLNEILLKKDQFQEADNTERFAAKVSRFFNEGIFIPLGSSMFALLSFYIASAAFRAFRLRSFEATLLMITAVLVVFGQVPMIASHWDGFPLIRNWLLTVPNTAAFRGISFGASIAGLVLAIRVWLSIDKNQVGA